MPTEPQGLVVLTRRTSTTWTGPIYFLQEPGGQYATGWNSKNHSPTTIAGRRKT
jgi:hypothetical protein